MKHPESGKIIATYKHFGWELPKELQNPPELHDLEYEIWSGFWELSTERRDGGPIGWRVIRDYAQTIGLNANVFSRIIRAMDEVYLTHKTEKARK